MATTKEQHYFDPSIPIVTHAQQHLAFLQEVNSIAASLEKPSVIANAVRRYETCWIPLLAAHTDEDLLPPLDVHWAWHVHMLCPHKYASDVMKNVGRLPVHQFQLLKSKRLQSDSKTKQIWSSVYPDEPFEVDFEKIDDKYTYQTSKVSYDIQAASFRQLQFFYNVSLPHFGLVPFLEKAKIRYMKFIYLKKLNKEAFLVPMYDIDLMWHTHQLSPAAYSEDYKSWLGYVLNHDDTSTDRSEGSHLNKSYANTRKLWQETFKEEYAIPGVGYRGPDPRGKLHEVPGDALDQYKPKAARIRLDSITYKHHKKTNKIKGHVKIVSEEGIKKIFMPEIEDEPFIWKEQSDDGLFGFEVKPDSSFYLAIHLKTMKGILAPLMNGEKIFKEDLNVMTEIKEMINTNTSHTEVGVGDHNESFVNLSFSLVDANIISNELEFELADSPFVTKVIMPETVESMWGPVCLPRLPEGVDNVCNVADHRLTTKNGLEVTVRVIHSLPLNMSVVQVYYQDKLAAISHLIGQEQLPTPNQISNDHKWMTLNVKKGERAMLIKNHAGDWAIIKGKWERAMIGQEYLDTHVKRLQVEKHTNFKVIYSASKGQYGNADDSFWFLDTKLFMKTKKLIVNCHYPESAEHIAAMFSALVLYVLCEPRRGDRPGADRATNAAARANQGADPSKCEFLRAAGYTTDTPSNSYLWWMRYLNTDKHHYHHSRYDDFDDYDWDDGTTSSTAEEGTESDTNGKDDACVMFCPWDPDNKCSNPVDLVSDFISNTGNTCDANAACGSCVTSSGHDTTGASNHHDQGHDSGFSSCASSGGGGSSSSGSGSGGGDKSSGGDNSGGGGGGSGDGGNSGGNSGGGGGGGGSSGGGGGGGSSCGSSCGGGGSSCGGD